jgi:hypothetical protein
MFKCNEGGRMTLSDFEPGKRYLIREYRHREDITESFCIEVSETAVKLGYRGDYEKWHSKDDIEHWALLELLKEGEK